MADAHDPIPLAPLESAQVFPVPALPGRVKVEADTHALFDALGGALMAAALDAVGRRGVFHLALSGGSTPYPFYMSLMTDPRWRAMPWPMTHLWIVDERCVPFDHERSNWRQIHEIFADHSGIPEAHLHPIDATAPDACERYEAELRGALGGQRGSAVGDTVGGTVGGAVGGAVGGTRGGAAHDREAQGRLDFALIGMGDNGHTASLFPETAVLDERERWIAPCDGPTVTPPKRITMTYPLLNATRTVAVLVVGAAKAAMIHRVATGNDTARELPIKGIRPESGELLWFLDCAAAGAAR